MKPKFEGAAHFFDIDQIAIRIQADEEPAAEVALLKIQTSLTMELVAKESTQVLGGAGYMPDSRVDRISREVRVNAIGGCSKEILRDLSSCQMGI
tara:strand:+ start:146 stop:430 length:285 start_codon:yes stop_codon:yes gene_type:complete